MNRSPVLETTPSTDVEKLFREEHKKICRRTDKLIALIMCAQWPGAILTSLLIGAKTWNGTESSVHPHVFAAIYLGGLITVLPVLLAFLKPGEQYTRHVIAACQIMMSGLLIHITGGRIETHFHVFGSLAFLAFYLDWEVLVTATLVALLDHAIMGYYAPVAIFGVAAGAGGRFIEHVLWVVFCDCFLITSCLQSLKGLRAAAKREADQEVLLFQAYHDSLTGLGNRLLMQQRMAAMMEAAARDQTGFALMSIDLDRFKEVNDTLGHHVGDMLLAETSKRLQTLIRKNDTLVRMGGDEFSLILDECSDVKLAERIAARMIESLNKPFVLAGNSLSVGASIGICLYPEAGREAEELFHHADLALYRAKNGGRNVYFVFDEAMRAETLRQMTLEHRLRIAVKEESFDIHYQPIVSSDESLLGFEALLRWEDTVLGRVTPDVFIPIAEKSGLIIQLGNWVLQKACMQAATWQTGERGQIKVSVNVSSVQFAHKDFVTTVLLALKESGLPPRLLDLELTESLLVSNHGQTQESLTLLRKFGIGLSIDDFGTGYSSLSYLRDLPIHRLKIDRAFVRDIATSKDARSLIESMIEMAHTLNLQVVAEGVEDREQLAVLSHAGCDEIQGFLISKAISAKDAGSFIDAQPSSAPEGNRTQQVLQKIIDGLTYA